ncbi:MAG: TMEM175 family protein [bacterium]
MPFTYNQLAGQNPERLEALSDGIFAFAMTLLALDIHVPDPGPIHSDHDLLRALIALSPNILPWLMSFITLGIFWVGQQTQLNHIQHTNLKFTWIHIAFLASVTVLPFSTRLLAEYLTYRVALVVYWLNLLSTGLLFLAGWTYARKVKLLKKSLTEKAYQAIRRRVLVGQSLYALGTCLCFFNNYLSIAFIMLIQINYVFAFRFLVRFTA